MLARIVNGFFECSGRRTLVAPSILSSLSPLPPAEATSAVQPSPIR